MKLIYAAFLATFTFCATVGHAQNSSASGSEAIAKANPYDDLADAKLDVQQALLLAKTDKVPVLLVFGANWCGDCKMLDAAMKTGSASQMIAHDFKVVKINVGKFDKNVDIAEKYGVPLKKGIPAIAILSPESTVLFATKAGELADARKMGDTGVYNFFKKAAVVTKVKN
jgi:thioredoxin 1